ncbi:MAG: Flp pilus assembly protein CpaB [Anaerolineales bacterium]|jgi:pilus assembly protein CpaB
MRRGRIFIFLALILIIGLAVVALVFRQFFSSAAPTAQTQPTTVQIYIAGQNIPQGEPITEDVLATMDIPQDKVVSVMFTLNQKDELVGKIAKYPIDQGVVITSSMVSEGELAAGGPSWAANVPDGMTAIALPTTRLESVAYGVRDGAHVNLSACFLFVDVDPSYQSELPNQVSVLTAPANVTPPEMAGVTLGIYPPDSPSSQGRTEVESAFQQGIYVVPSEPQRPRLVCQMLLQNVVVLKMGSFPFQQTPVDTGQTDQQQGQVVQQVDQNPDVVTLIVSPQDSVTMSYLIYSGAKITMTLRKAADESRVATEAATLQFLLSQYNIPVPAKLPYTMEPRIDELISPLLPGDVVTVAPEQ